MFLSGSVSKVKNTTLHHFQSTLISCLSSLIYAFLFNPDTTEGALLLLLILNK